MFKSEQQVLLNLERILLLPIVLSANAHKCGHLIDIIAKGLKSPAIVPLLQLL